jgi:hypothetical protein
MAGHLLELPPTALAPASAAAGKLFTVSLGAFGLGTLVAYGLAGLFLAGTFPAGAAPVPDKAGSVFVKAEIVIVGLTHVAQGLCGGGTVRTFVNVTVAVAGFALTAALFGVGRKLFQDAEIGLAA